MDMQPERFLRDMKRLCKACSAESIETWIHWARECVGAKQYLNLIPLPDEQAVSAWLDSYYASFYFIKQEFGAETAAKSLNFPVPVCVFIRLNCGQQRRC